jgi:hypothetical protein
MAMPAARSGRAAERPAGLSGQDDRNDASRRTTLKRGHLAEHPEPNCKYRRREPDEEAEKRPLREVVCAPLAMRERRPIVLPFESGASGLDRALAVNSAQWFSLKIQQIITLSSCGKRAVIRT